MRKHLCKICRCNMSPIVQLVELFDTCRGDKISEKPVLHIHERISSYEGAVRSYSTSSLHFPVYGQKEIVSLLQALATNARYMSLRV
jgi:hypothetical protein